MRGLSPGRRSATTENQPLVAGRTWVGVGKISRPTMTFHSPKEKNTGAAVVVFPGGGYWILAIDLEGTEVCRVSRRTGREMALFGPPKIRNRRSCTRMTRTIWLMNSTTATKHLRGEIILVKATSSSLL